MATMTAFAHGQFSWVDLMAKDSAGAKEFYGQLFGWEALDQDTQGGPPYTLFALHGQHVCGMGELNAEMAAMGMPPVWNSYITVDDINAATAKATELGATVIVPSMAVVDAGHMAVLQDPTGAPFMLWQKINHCGAQVVNEPNCWVWNELLTRDPAASEKFYSELFGWTFEKEETPGPNEYWMAKNNERMNGGMMKMPDGMAGVPPHWSVYFAVADINTATDKLKELGGNVLRGPFEVSVGHITVVTDAQGAAFQLIQMTVPADE